MKLAMVGLGRMGANIATRLIAGVHSVIAYDRSPDAVTTSARGGATGWRHPR